MQFTSNYDPRVVICECKMFIRLTANVNNAKIRISIFGNLTEVDSNLL